MGDPLPTVHLESPLEIGIEGDLPSHMVPLAMWLFHGEEPKESPLSLLLPFLPRIPGAQERTYLSLKGAAESEVRESTWKRVSEKV